MFSHILVPLDGSCLAERVLPHVEQFAQIFGSRVTLLQILDAAGTSEHLHSVDPLSWQIRKAEAEMYMQKIAERVRKNLQESSPGKRGKEGEKDRVDYFIREGKTAENIVNFAHEEGVDLLAITTHGAGGLSRWNVSSITQKVINLIYLPVLVVRAYTPGETENEKIHYRRILLPIDSSRRAECSFPAALALTRGRATSRSGGGIKDVLKTDEVITKSKTDSILVLSAVIKPIELPIPEPYPSVIEELSQELMEASRKAVNNYLNEMKARLSVDCEIYVLEAASVSSAIQDLATREEDIDLVVLCAHGHTGPITWPYGSVTRNYLEHGTKPVLVIQDVPRSQVQKTAAEIAAEISGKR